ncbi:hypothetical protein [Streptomyces sp. 769]|uniref:hypothetical protein n=1 Tax=Streptomyces sp. 769 TaxID=1262452 RepID=UPI000581E76F|nr:hypothetical protein [Streptomyces sp. 769]AJC52707.1 hypothetical protein GZL_00099 [Streptomyces sp. 769]AJC61832.1 hypothetical protein GZL_09314 [Streptomyces sp. 769]
MLIVVHPGTSCRLDCRDKEMYRHTKFDRMIPSFDVVRARRLPGPHDAWGSHPIRA